jgi:hypothetical protein
MTSLVFHFLVQTPLNALNINFLSQMCELMSSLSLTAGIASSIHSGGTSELNRAHTR